MADSNIENKFRIWPVIEAHACDAQADLGVSRKLDEPLVIAKKGASKSTGSTRSSWRPSTTLSRS